MSNFAQEYSIIKAFIIKGSNKESDRGAIHFAPYGHNRQKNRSPVSSYYLSNLWSNAVHF